MIAPLGILTGGFKIKAAIAATVAVSLLHSAPEMGADSFVPAPPAQHMTYRMPAQSAPPALEHQMHLWRYLRAGLNYIEASGKEVPIDFVHPGGVAYGPLALTRIAVKDVIQRVPAFAGYTIDEVLQDSVLYEQCAILYADILLRHYLQLELAGLSKEEVFTILQKAWFLGPTLYKKGRALPLSRIARAQEYLHAAS